MKSKSICIARGDIDKMKYVKLIIIALIEVLVEVWNSRRDGDSS